MKCYYKYSIQLRLFIRITKSHTQQIDSHGILKHATYLTNPPLSGETLGFYFIFMFLLAYFTKRTDIIGILRTLVQFLMFVVAAKVFLVLNLHC